MDASAHASRRYPLPAPLLFCLLLLSSQLPLSPRVRARSNPISIEHEVFNLRAPRFELEKICELRLCWIRSDGGFA